MSVAISAGLFFASRVLATVSVLGLAYAAVILMFTVPKVYDMHSAEIDGAVNMFRQKATFLYVLINDSSFLLGFNPRFWYSLARSFVLDGSLEPRLRILSSTGTMRTWPRH